MILIAQFDKMVDRQFRALFEYEYVHRKVSNFGVVGWLMSLVFLGKAHVCIQLLRFFCCQSLLLKINRSLALVDYHEDLVLAEAMSAEPPPSVVNERLRVKVVVVEIRVQLWMRYLLPIQAEIRDHRKTALESLYDPFRRVKALSRT